MSSRGHPSDPLPPDERLTRDRERFGDTKMGMPADMTMTDGDTAPLPDAQKGPTIAPGDHVGPFVVVRMLGHGGMGEVWLARDSTLGRRVALKMVRPDRLGHRDAIERLLVEARATATLSHPHIATVYSVGEHKGVPFLALEYVSGPTLGDRLRQGRLGVRETMRVCRAIADALACAHGRGIAHRDLKPDNVLLPPDGRVRVVDFGLAKMIDPPKQAAGKSDHTDPLGSQPQPRNVFETRDDAIRGSPAYMSPEQWRGRGTKDSDVWALGLILVEALTGRHPFAGRTYDELMPLVTQRAPLELPELDDEIPARLRALVQACLKKQAEQRPSAEEVFTTLSRLVSEGVTTEIRVDNPFCGLLAFSEERAGLFFGRDAEIDAFVARVQQQVVLPIVGPSGAGKSSFVHAGVVPRLREQSRYTLLAMRPGPRPFTALATRLLRPDSLSDVQPPAVDVGTLAATLQDEPATLGLMLADRAERTGTSALLVVDALEEICTQVADPDVRLRFMQAVCCAGVDVADPVRVVLTLREDFLGRLALDPIARDVLGRAFVLRSPDVEGLAEILGKPVAAVDHGWEPGLIKEIVKELGGEHACLPLLQFAGALLWEKRDRKRRLIVRSAYEAIGGVAGALAHHGDGVLAALPPVEVRIARELLLRLVTPEKTRRQMARKEAIAGLGPEAGAVLDRLIEARLLTQRRPRDDVDGGDVELAHESLITRWGQLAKWIDESREEIAVLAEVRQAAELWQKRGGRIDDAWRGDALRDARRVLARHGELPDVIRRFLDAGVEREKLAQRRRRTVIGVSLAALTLVALTSVGVAARIRAEQLRTEEARRIAEIRRAEAEREGAAAALARGDALEARARLRTALELVDEPRTRALWDASSRVAQQWQIALGNRVGPPAFSPDGKHIVIGRGEGGVAVIDVASLDITVLSENDGYLPVAAFSPDGKLRSATRNGARVWDINSATSTPRALPFDAPAPGRVPGSSFTISRDGLHAAMSTDKETIMADIDTGVVVARFDVAGARGMAYPVAGGPLLGIGDKDFVVLDPKSGASSPPYPLPLEGVFVGELDRAGKRMALGSTDGRVALLDVERGGGPPRVGAARMLPAHAGRVFWIAFDAAGERIATSGEDGYLRVWDVETLARIAEVPSYGDGKLYVALSPDGRLLVATSIFTGDTRAWRVDNASAAVSTSHTQPIACLEFARDGTTAMSASLDGAIRVWNVETGASRVLTTLPTQLWCAQRSADESLIVANGKDGVLRLLDARTGAERSSVPAHRQGVYTAAFSHKGDMIASVGEDGTVRGFSVPDLEPRWRTKATAGGITDLAFAPDDSVIAVGLQRKGEVVLLDPKTGNVKRTFDAGGNIYDGVDYGGDGRFVAVGRDGGVGLVELATGAASLLPQPPRTIRVEFDATGARVAAPGGNGVLKVWTLASLGQSSTAIDFVGHLPGADVNTAAFSPDGARLISGGDDATVRLWDAATGQPLWRAPAVLVVAAGRVAARHAVFTHRGWRNLDDGSAAAIEPAAWRRAIEARATRAEMAGAYVCIASASGVELWDTVGDRPKASAHTPPTSILGLDRACAFIANGALTILDDNGARVLAEQASAIGRSDTGFVAAVPAKLVTFGGDGVRQATRPTTARPSALAASGDVVVAGDLNGRVLIDDRAMSVLGLPSSAVTRVAIGPAGTVVAGFVSGVVAVFSPADGSRLITARLHGPIAHLVVDDSRVHIVSELGDLQTLDLATLAQPRCELLAAVWRDVGVIWENGRLRTAPPPADHECRSTR